MDGGVRLPVWTLKEETMKCHDKETPRELEPKGCRKDIVAMLVIVLFSLLVTFIEPLADVMCAALGVK